MKGVLSWLKSNVLLVILAILTVVPLPVAWYFASGMNRSLVEGRQQDAQRVLRDVQGVTVEYQLEPLTPEQEPVSYSSPPNQKVTEHFKAEQDRRLAQVETVKSAAIEYNRRGRGPLVEGLFPEPVGESQLKRNEMARRAAAADTRDSAYNQLLRNLRIRPPVNGEELASLIQVQRDRKVSEVTGDQGEQALSEKQREQINGQMLDLRITRYRTHAIDTAFYGSLDVLPPSVPRSAPVSPPPLEQCFEWQFDYWLIEDLLHALSRANADLDATGNGGNVVSGVVKRVDRIDIDPAPFVGSQPSGGRDDFGGRTSNQPATVTGRSPVDSGLYDVRYATLSLTVSSAKLPALLDAISSSNFMTVLDVDLFEVDPWADLEAGYYYGSDAVVRAEIRVEVLHLRAWTVPFMPESVKQMLGLSGGSDGED